MSDESMALGGMTVRVLGSAGSFPQPGNPSSGYLVRTPTVSFSRTEHPVETLAVRVEEDGAIFGYSADTGPGWSFTELDPTGQGFDLAVCEATLNPEHAGLAAHLTAAQAGAMATTSNVRSLALTHMYHWTIEDRLRQAAEVFEGELAVAHPGTVFHLTSSEG